MATEAPSVKSTAEARVLIFKLHLLLIRTVITSQDEEIVNRTVRLLLDPLSLRLGNSLDAQGSDFVDGRGPSFFRLSALQPRPRLEQDPPDLGWEGDPELKAPQKSKKMTDNVLQVTLEGRVESYILGSSRQFPLPPAIPHAVRRQYQLRFCAVRQSIDCAGCWDWHSGLRTVVAAPAPA